MTSERTAEQEVDRLREHEEDLRREGARHLWPLFAAAALVGRNTKVAVALADEMVEEWKKRQRAVAR